MHNLDKIEKIFGMIGSDSDGETLNAVALIKRNLKAQGKNWNDFSKHLFGAAPRREKQYSKRPGSAWDMPEGQWDEPPSHPNCKSGFDDDYFRREKAKSDQQFNEARQRSRESAERRENESYNEYKSREEKPHANNGKYSYGDPYPGYSEHKKMALELVNTIINKTSTMTQWETSFIQDIYNKNICMARSLSSKQESILQRIYEQYIKS